MSAITSRAPDLPEAEAVPEPRPRGRQDATRGSLWRVVFALALPILGITCFEVVRSAVELRVVGELGSLALDTFVTVNQAFRQLLMTFIIAISWGASALVAQRIGARDPADAGHTLGQSLGLAFMVGLVALCLANVATGPLIGGLQLGENGAVAVIFLRVTGFVMTAGFVLFALNTTLQATGDVVTPFYMFLLSVGTYLLLVHPLSLGLGRWPGLGLVGVLVAQCTGAVASLTFGLWRMRRLHWDLRVGWRSLLVRDWARVRDIARLSWPVWLQILCRSVGIILLLHLTRGYGVAARAGYGVGLRIDMMLLSVGLAFAGAAATVTGQNVGARHLRRAARGAWIAWVYYTGIMLCCTALFWWNAEGVAGIFSDDPEVIAVAALYLRIASSVYPFLASNFVFTRAMQGAGDVRTPTYITLFVTAVVLAPLLFILPKIGGLGVSGLFLAGASAMTVGGVLQAWFFQRGRWRRARLARLARAFAQNAG